MIHAEKLMAGPAITTPLGRDPAGTKSVSAHNLVTNM
jgi:hypothetical protein